MTSLSAEIPGSNAASPLPSTVDPADVARFSAIAAEWWDENGKFRPLHRLNPVRLTYIRDVVCGRLGRDALGTRPLEGLRLVDVGCGGGLLTEPLSRMGADALGIDASEKNVRTAATHAAETGAAARYQATTAEALAASGQTFDVVVCMEVIEHVADVPLFIDCLSRLLAPGGVLFLATLNRTVKSYAMAIIGAEYVLRWLPKGTHNWKQFLKPSELAAQLRPHGLAFGALTGVVYDPLGGGFHLSASDLDVNYMGWAVRG